MHVMQFMLVKADDYADAMGTVVSKLDEPSTPEWSDWHNATGGTSFAGRWEGVFGEGHPDYLSYGAEPEVAEQFISDALNTRMAHYEEMRQRIGNLEEFHKQAQSYNPYDEGTGSWTVVWNVNRMAKLLDNDWTSDSAIYDLENYTAGLSYFRKDVTENPDKWWLIPVDFHF